MKESANGSEKGYFMPASLVNKLIVSILVGIVSIAGYMVVWAINDTQWKASQEAKIDLLTQQMSLINTKVSVGILPIADERIKNLQERVKELEEREAR